MYFLVKHAGFIDDARLAQIQEVHPKFCHVFEEVCVRGDKEPPPKFHILYRHILPFIEAERAAWEFSEEAIENLHHLILHHAERNARLPGHENKLLGTLKAFNIESHSECQRISEDIKVKNMRPKK